MQSCRAAFLLTVLSLPFLTGCQVMNGYAMNQAGTQQYQRGNYLAARQSFQRAVYDDPSNPDYYSNLASATFKQGDLAGAERIYQQALRLDPSHQPAYHGLGMVLLKEGRQGEAIALMDGWVNTQPYLVQPHIEMAWLQKQLGNPVASEQSLQQALRVQPQNAIALSQLGHLYQERGQANQAVAMYSRSLQVNGRQPEVRSRLAALKGHSQPPAYQNRMTPNRQQQPGSSPQSQLASNNRFYQQQPEPKGLFPQLAKSLGFTKVNTAYQPRPMQQQQPGYNQVAYSQNHPGFQNQNISNQREIVNAPVFQSVQTTSHSNTPTLSPNLTALNPPQLPIQQSPPVTGSVATDSLAPNLSPVLTPPALLQPESSGITPASHESSSVISSQEPVSMTGPSLSAPLLVIPSESSSALGAKSVFGMETTINNAEPGWRAMSSQPGPQSFGPQEFIEPLTSEYPKIEPH